MSDRDELARLLFITDNRNADDPAHEWEMLSRHASKHVEYVYEMADALLAAGYRKPRTITTVEELRALQGESVVRDAAGLVYERDYIVDDPTIWWWSMAGYDGKHASGTIALPATVLFEPEET